MATGLTLLPPLRPSPAILFFPAVVVASHWGRLGPTLTVIILSSMIVNYFFFASEFSLLGSLADVVRFAAFAIVGGSVHYLGNQLRSIAARLDQENIALDIRVQEKTAELVTSNEMLVQEVNVRRNTELALRNTEADLRVALDKVGQSLKEKEILLRELQHRVKNNLQVISSLLSLQKHRIQDPSFQQLFLECQQRVRVIALVHERLCSSPNVTSFGASDYFNQLVHELFESHFVGTWTVQPQVVVSETVISVDRLIPCALIVNELVCNSLKYAFPNGRPGEVRVDLHRNDGKINLIVADNGIGYSPRANSGEHLYGLQIVEALVEQLCGTLDWAIDSGTRVTVTFPEKS